MKQKNNSSNLVTKVFLKDELISLDTRFDIKLDRLAKRIDDNAQKYRDQILASNDKLVKELEGMREDKIIGSGQTARIQKQVDNHEKRIKKIEHVQNVT